MTSLKPAPQEKDITSLLNLSGIKKFQKLPISHTTSFCDDQNQLMLPSLRENSQKKHRQSLTSEILTERESNINLEIFSNIPKKFVSSDEVTHSIRNDYERKKKYDLLAVIRKKTRYQKSSEKENKKGKNMEKHRKTGKNFFTNLKRFSIAKLSEDKKETEEENIDEYVNLLTNSPYKIISTLSSSKKDKKENRKFYIEMKTERQKIETPFISKHENKVESSFVKRVRNCERNLKDKKIKNIDDEFLTPW